MTEKHIIYCNCRGTRIQPAIKKAVEDVLHTAPVQVTMLSDLCGLAVLNKEELKGIFAGVSETLVIGCYKRTMSLLFSQAGIDELSHNPEYLNLIDERIDNAVKKIADFTGNTTGSSGYNTISADSAWPSWYPIIDYSRCTACGQCADFCLFGVYEKSAKVEVVHPQGCKNNCPACARICPQTALIFPKYKNGGAIGGSEEIDEMAEQARLKQDMEVFLGDDIFAALEKRKLKRRSIIREEAMKKALEEKEKAAREN